MKTKQLLMIIALLLVVVPVSADQVTFDDAIINGSACVGLDCVNGEVFGFSTLILKENNLRVYFDDTSTTAAFPSTDWQLVANDSSNGGRNRFSIEDVTEGQTPFTVMSGAPTGSLMITGDGLVGLGTSSPVTDVHVASGDTPTLRLEQAADLGWPPYAWDIGANEVDFFVRDVTSQTTPVRVENGAVDNSLVISQDGNVTIAGTLSQGSSRHIKQVSPVDASDILQRLQSLDVSRWRYRNDSTQSEHLGPMAEDFHRLFGLGVDDKHIAASDVAGVAVTSIQALVSKLDHQAEEMARVNHENEALKARIQRIETLLAE